MELGPTADRRTPLTAADRQPGSLSITGAPKGPPNGYGPPGGVASWGAPQYPYNTECRTGYQVTYEGIQRSNVYLPLKQGVNSSPAARET